jgi:hypothetical protein
VSDAVRPRAVLATCSRSLFLVTMDIIVNVALPALGHELGATVGSRRGGDRVCGRRGVARRARRLARMIAAFVFLGAGLGVVNAPITNAAVSGMPRALAGVASALAATCVRSAPRSASRCRE